MNGSEKQGIIDHEHMWLLSLFHYVSGGLTIAFSSMFVFHLLFFNMLSSNPDMLQQPGAEGVAESLGFLQIFVWVFGLIVVLGVTYGICELVSGYFIKQRKYRVFSLLVAIPRLLLLPYGTILSVFTLLLLERSSIKAEYDRARQTSPVTQPVGGPSARLTRTGS